MCRWLLGRGSQAGGDGAWRAWLRERVQGARPVTRGARFRRPCRQRSPDFAALGCSPPQGPVDSG